MYHRGVEPGWHRGHHPMDVPPSRGHRSRPYRGGYHDHREHDGYGSYHDNSCHDRNYDDNQYVEYHDRSYQEYYEENQSYNEYQEHREPVYNRGGHHDGGYNKETYYRGSYQRGRGDPARYRGHATEAPHKKYPQKSFKHYKKENEFHVKKITPEPVQKVIHNPGRTVVTLTPGITEDTSEEKSYKAKSPEKDNKPSQDSKKPSQEIAKLESTKKEVATKKEVVIKKEVVEVDNVEILTPPSNKINETLPASNIESEATESKKEDTLQTEQTVQEEKEHRSVNPGKRAQSEEKDVDLSVDHRKGESFAAKRPCTSHDRDECHLEKTVEIPLLGGLDEMPSETVVTASTSNQNTGSAVNCDLPDAAQELRTAFILARKEQIEVVNQHIFSSLCIVCITF
ncbi:uncharacterized protein ACNLHF_009561 isoform 2-T3 [Anomaloglossus baeobatrachus]|uniref:uncharacterized protein LOC142291323 isoform X2 n=1 Tax=Anomaloglossus baeobatrachus TaxID=238106 RepID=UPI003F4F46AB